LVKLKLLAGLQMSGEEAAQLGWPWLRLLASAGRGSQRDRAVRQSVRAERWLRVCKGAVIAAVLELEICLQLSASLPGDCFLRTLRVALSKPSSE